MFLVHWNTISLLYILACCVLVLFWFSDHINSLEKEVKSCIMHISIFCSVRSQCWSPQDAQNFASHPSKMPRLITSVSNVSLSTRTVCMQNFVWINSALHKRDKMSFRVDCVEFWSDLNGGWLFDRFLQTLVTFGVLTKDYQLSRAHDVDLDVGSSHTAYRRASLIHLYLHAKFHRNKETFCGQTDGRTFETHFRRVDLKYTTLCKWSTDTMAHLVLLLKYSDILVDIIN